MSEENTGGEGEGQGQVGGEGQGQGGEGAGAASGSESQGQSQALWTDTLPDDLKGFVGNKGWEDPTAAVNSYRELEKFAGSKANYVELPDPDNQEDVHKILSSLGAPEAADGYNIKLPEGSVPDEKMMGGFKEMAAANKFTPAQAQAAVDWFENTGAEMRDTSAAEDQANSEKEIEAIKQKYGKEYDSVIASGQTLVRKLGLPTEELNAIEDKIGTSALISLTAKLGKMLGETPLKGDEGTGEMGMTPHQAKAKIGERGADPAFRKRLFDPNAAGHATAKADWDRWNQIAAGAS